MNPADAPPLVLRDATALARDIREKRVSSREVVEAHLARIEAKNPLVRAVVAKDFERARARALAADEALAAGTAWGPLHGVPFTAKDTYATEGLTTTFAQPQLLGHVPDYDATLVARLRGAGGILLGKTAAPLFAFDWQTVGMPTFGRTRNPHHLGHTPGGSSGGSASALASGMTPLCLGSDLGGSIRVPAHCCGVVGLRPTEGALSDRGHLEPPGTPRLGRRLVTCGPMARSVRDLSLALEVLWGPDPSRWELPPVPLDHAPREVPSLRGLRVAYDLDFADVEVSYDTRKALESLLEALRDAGAVVTPDAPSLDWREAHRVWGALVAQDLYAGAPWPARAAPCSREVGELVLRARFGPGRFSSSLREGLVRDPLHLLRALSARDALVSTADGFFARYDVWLTPSGAGPAFRHRRTGAAVRIDDREVPYTEVFSPFHCPTALLGNPVLALPVGRSREGLPIGAQVHARRWHDARLLAIGELMEALTGGFQEPSWVGG